MSHKRSGATESLWERVRVPQFSPLAKDETADVCVIGAGIAGLTTAYLLSREGKRVVVLDDGPICDGETGRTTAHLANALDDRYCELEKLRGEDASRLAAISHGNAIDFIEKTVKEESIDCNFERLDGFLFLGHGQPKSLLEDERKAARTAGLDVELLERAPLRAFDTGPCLQFPRQGQFHPLKYLSVLAEKIVKNGGLIHTHSRVTQIDEDTQPVTIHSQGNIVSAQSLVVATNAPINDNAAIFTKQAPYRSYVLGFRVPAGSVHRALYWDTLDPYHYIRLQADDEDAAWEILIVGGEDHKTGQHNDMEHRYKKLEDWTRKRFPAAGDLLYRWSGQVLETLDGLAMIGRRPFGKDWSYIATGDSGMGMTHGTIAGLLLTDLILGRPNAWEELYDPGRFPLRTAKEFIKENANVAGTLVGDWVAPSEVESDTDIKPGSGAIMRKGMTKIALYRDPQGMLHTFSAVCPHKGCIVQWNQGEQSWDCPCHGSRYDAHGAVLNGPTIKPLKPADA